MLPAASVAVAVTTLPAVRTVGSTVEKLTVLEMNDPEDDVRVYLHDDDGSTNVWLSRATLRLDEKTGTFTPGSQLLRLPYTQSGPAPRGAENSPARKKAK